MPAHSKLAKGAIEQAQPSATNAEAGRDEMAPTEGNADIKSCLEEPHLVESTQQVGRNTGAVAPSTTTSTHNSAATRPTERQNIPGKAPSGSFATASGKVRHVKGSKSGGYTKTKRRRERKRLARTTAYATLARAKYGDLTGRVQHPTSTLHRLQHILEDDDVNDPSKLERARAVVSQEILGEFAWDSEDSDCASLGGIPSDSD
ncbi:hypothetical protein CC1G_01462 [Coprinopsis cinerea okayama7|uniref:Uncharacterized protein n=1 Tax=Coprinopsis cinerea (strain Okayama-7 / 130 / ATCC MYA-4618 / FGSC 9003) TaxID=240176 RepID=A8NYX4_COPC7|nr:hypothetical protein CC1G_01462 [Coprinopsis cinerea okayama7\|eukprot:XP_001837550.1 hypothetical protein CC1G_01462 [Coprinopsis cinerea okayama7\